MPRETRPPSRGYRFDTAKQRPIEERERVGKSEYRDILRLTVEPHRVRFLINELLHALENREPAKLIFLGEMSEEPYE